ncbi:hypothetical protein [Paraburkholderia azotifigens]|uniref:hypothetical protein n=1 Tax=Paraburkholderia azotifigens TaxID=2057004 RepID=UPI0038B78078
MAKPVDHELDELRIEINQYDWAEYIGSRAQLEAEGIIPKGTEWPTGKRTVQWASGPLRFWLRRRRPDGMKGPAKLWLEGDHWFLRIDRANVSGWDGVIRRKTRELKEVLYRNSNEGQRHFTEIWTRYEAACDDKRYQTFRALIPALSDSDRRRTRRNASSVQESGHE